MVRLTERQERYLQEFEQNLMLLAADGAPPPSREIMLAYLCDTPEDSSRSDNLQSWAVSNARSENRIGIMVIEAALGFTDECQAESMKDVGDHSIFRS